MTVTSHRELLNRAEEVRHAAAGHDLGRLRLLVDELLDDFVVHVDDERPALRRLPTFTARLVARGRTRILDDLVALSLETDDVDHAAEPGATACRCTQLGAEIVALLSMQADAERRAFARVAGPRT